METAIHNLVQVFIHSLGLAFQINGPDGFQPGFGWLLILLGGVLTIYGRLFPKGKRRRRK
jgi:hypothetical protein